MAGRRRRGFRKTDGSCVLPMASRRRRIGYTSRRLDDGRAQEAQFSENRWILRSADGEPTMAYRVYVEEA